MEKKSNSLSQGMYLAQTIPEQNGFLFVNEEDDITFLVILKNT